MIDGTVFPDARQCMTDLIDGQVHLDETVTAVWHLAADSYTNPDLWPLVLVYTGDGTEGYVDRVDRVTLECYAPGTRAVDTLESIKSLICGAGIDTPHGYLDSIAVDLVPKDTDLQSDILNRARATFLVTSRPL
jgi:hypothetical protein